MAERVKSLEALLVAKKLVDPDSLTLYAKSAGFSLVESNAVNLETGKSFRVLTYRLEG